MDDMEPINIDFANEDGESLAYASAPAVPRQGDIVWLKASDLEENGSAFEEVACLVLAVEWKISRDVAGISDRRLSAYVICKTTLES